LRELEEGVGVSATNLFWRNLGEEESVEDKGEMLRCLLDREAVLAHEQRQPRQHVLSSQLRSPPNRSIGTLSMPQYLTTTLFDVSSLAVFRHHNYIPISIIIQAKHGFHVSSHGANPLEVQLCR